MATEVKFSETTKFDEFRQSIRVTIHGGILCMSKHRTFVVEGRGYGDGTRRVQVIRMEGGTARHYELYRDNGRSREPVPEDIHRITITLSMKGVRR